MAGPRYKRAVLKVSGEDGFTEPGKPGFDLGRIRKLAAMITAAHALGTELAIVVGGGNILRGDTFAKAGVTRVAADYMGMLATVLNALVLQDLLEHGGLATRVCTSIEVAGVAEPYIRRRAIRHLEKGRVVILAAGTGNPTFTTDTAAAVRAKELGAEILLKATKVDGVYDADPETTPGAKRYDRLTYMDLIRDRLRVMDATAITQCMETGIPVLVFDLWADGALLKALRGERVGTLITADGPAR